MKYYFMQLTLNYLCRLDEIHKIEFIPTYINNSLVSKIQTISTAKELVNNTTPLDEIFKIQIQMNTIT